MEITNHYGLPEVIVEAVRMDRYDRGVGGPKYITATELVNPPQLTKLLWKHKDSLVEDASERIWALLGQAVHSVIERAGDSPQFADRVIAEERFYAELDGWKIGGQVDIYDKGQKKLTDFKITSVWSVRGEMKAAWRRQLNLLAWLLRKNGLEVERAEIVAVLRDWSRTKAKYDSSYPDQSVAVVEAELVDDEVIEGFISRQLAELESRQPRECSDEERWRSGGNWAVMRGDSVKWAVMRQGRRTAVRVYEGEDEAMLHIRSSPDLYIEERRAEASDKRRAVKVFESLLEAEGFIAAHPEGNFRLEGREAVYQRCESYCPVRHVCRQAAGDSQVFAEGE
jgi:hypothetical protein